MSDQSIQDIAVQKILQLPKEEALRVLIFIAGLEAGYEISKQDHSLDQDGEPTGSTRRTGWGLDCSSYMRIEHSSVAMQPIHKE